MDALKEVLSDEDETIRKLGLKVVRILIKKFAVRNMKLIISGVKDGLFSYHRPQRLSSVKLLGEIIH